jgi:ankyrin repeat protein
MCGRCSPLAGGTGSYVAPTTCILGGMGPKESDRPLPSGLGFAVWSDDEARVRTLLAEGAPADDYGDGVVDKTPLMESVDEIEGFYDDSRAAVTRLLLDHQADVHRRDRDGWTALHYAVGAGRAAVLLLLEAGADPNAAAADGATPLHEAVRRMNAGSVVALCSFGADRSAVDDQGRTPANCLYTQTVMTRSVR